MQPREYTDAIQGFACIGMPKLWTYGMSADLLVLMQLYELEMPAITWSHGKLPSRLAWILVYKTSLVLSPGCESFPVCNFGCVPPLISTTKSDDKPMHIVEHIYRTVTSRLNRVVSLLQCCIKLFFGQHRVSQCQLEALVVFR